MMQGDLTFLPNDPSVEDLTRTQDNEHLLEWLNNFFLKLVL